MEKWSMDFHKYFPIWEKLTKDQQSKLSSAVSFHQVKGGTVLHNGDIDCIGLLLIRSGQLRVFVLSDEGREITLYRLFDMDICLFSASCVKIEKHGNRCSSDVRMYSPARYSGS